MSLKLQGVRLLVLMAIGAVFFLHRTPPKVNGISLKVFLKANLAKATGDDEEEQEADFTKERILHEFEMLRNPVTGTIPRNIHAIEREAASKIPDRNPEYNPLLSGITGTGSINTQNNYVSVGPNNQAGRSRTLGIDRRNTNIMITGGTTGGIFRSTNGGASWTFVSGENDIRSCNAVAQDPINPDTWYCGTGEAYFVESAQDIAGTFGHGIFKSTDNGVTWSKLTTTEGNQNQFDNPFDLVHRIAVHPTTGYVYVAAHRRIMRSKDGGATWEQVLGSTTTSTALGGLTEVIIPSNGSKIYAAVTGENPDRNLVGVWESATGDASSWKRIAGGVSGQPDSVAGWRAYKKWGRIVLALNSTNDKLFVLYKNGDSASGPSPRPEADLFRYNISNSTWDNLSGFVPDEPNFNLAGIDPYSTQFNGFDMSIAVKPDNDNMLFIGGTVLERVDLTQTLPAKKFRRMGGYGKGFFPDSENNFIYPDHHPDIHGIYFLPGNNDVLYTASDGGIHKTATSVLADTVRWQPRDSMLQTLQYQFVNISPETDFDFIIGGAQDNGTLINLNAPLSQEHIQIGGGDGASAAISNFTKNGTTWKQSWYSTISQGSIYRDNISLNTSTSSISEDSYTEITPTGLGGKGQWLTLIVNDPDSSQDLYYNNHNKLYRTTNATTVTSGTWTELTGVGSTIPSAEDFTAMALSKRNHGNQYLYFATDNGHVYRYNNPSTAAQSATPVNITPTTMTAGSYVAGIAVNPRSADTIMVVVSNYDAASSTISNIFWTGNATSATPTWQVLDGALEPVSSQSCAIVVKTSGVEYYVGTSVGLYSTTTINGINTTWLKEGSGMIKTAIIRSLAVRQKDNTMVVGTHGNGAFEAQIGDAVVLDNNVATGINDPVINDKNFISAVYPTLTSTLIQYRTGNMFTIKKILVQVFNMAGQQLYKNEAAYSSGAVDISTFARGHYLLVINSDDGKYRYIQKVIKQ